MTWTAQIIAKVVIPAEFDMQETAIEPIKETNTEGSGSGVGVISHNCTLVSC